jgi:Predicted nucleic acid-binding protein, contains PIN domain
MILVDTSVLIGYLKGLDKDPIKKLDEIIEGKIPFGINNFIYQEILQGSRDKKEFEELKEYLGSLRFYELKYGKESYEKAGSLYFQCRKSGLTIRSTIDLLIAETAIENELFLLEDDNDYKAISKVIKDLKLYK